MWLIAKCFMCLCLLYFVSCGLYWCCFCVAGLCSGLGMVFMVCIYCLMLVLVDFGRFV